MEFRAKIKELCQQNGITQKMLAERMGISDISLNKTLRGEYPQLQTLEKIAAALGVEIGDLFAPSEPVLRCPHCGKPINVELTTGGDD